MKKTYGLAIEKPFTLVPLKLPLMTLADARKAQATLAAMKYTTHVINLETE